MAASTGVLAAERERLQREIDALSTGLPDGAVDVVRRAREILDAHEGKLAELRKAKAAIDAKFGVTQRDRIDAMQKAEAERLAELRADLSAYHSAKLAAVAEAQAHLREYVEATNRSIQAHLDLLKTASALSDGRRSTLTAELGVSSFVSRVSGRLCAHLSKIETPGTLKGAAGRIGELALPNSSLYPTTDDWVAKEMAVAGTSVQAVIDEGRI